MILCRSFWSIAITLAFFSLTLASVSNPSLAKMERRRRDLEILFGNSKSGKPVTIRHTRRFIDLPTENEEEKNPIVVSSEVMDYDTGSITLREGRRLMVNCEFQRDDLAHKSDLNWKKANGNSIDAETSSSLFSVIMSDRGPHFKRTSLHFNSVHPRDTGYYMCSARTVGGETFEKTIKINVLPQLQWSSNETTVGALLGEPLTIDCGVVSDGKERIIQLSAGTGELLDENIFKIAGHEATIESLAKEHAGMVVSCVTVEMYGETRNEEFPVVDRKDVNIEVFHKPEFASPESTAYAVIDSHVRNVFVHCNVTSSYPPARHFTFFHEDVEIDPSLEKYDVLVDVGRAQGAHLHILNVNEEDLGKYRCETSNTKAKSHHDILLKEAFPPSEPRVTLVETRKHSIIWKVEKLENESDMPINAIEIRHLRDTQADATGLADEAIDDTYWNTHSIKIQKNINKDNLYEIHGLRNAHEYVWRFRQISDAGFGESVVLRAKTFDENAVDSYTASATSFSVSLIFVFMAQYFL